MICYLLIYYKHPHLIALGQCQLVVIFDTQAMKSKMTLPQKEANALADRTEQAEDKRRKKHVLGDSTLWLLEVTLL